MKRNLKQDCMEREIYSYRLCIPIIFFSYLLVSLNDDLQGLVLVSDETFMGEMEKIKFFLKKTFLKLNIFNLKNCPLF